MSLLKKVCIKVMTVEGNLINYHENNAPMKSNINGPKFGLFFPFERVKYFFWRVKYYPDKFLTSLLTFSFIHPYLFG